MPSGSRNRLARVLIIGLGLAALGFATPANAAKFGVQSLKGAYAGALSGASAFTTLGYVPDWVVVRFVANGNGGLRPNVIATYNLGGCVILRLSKGEGTYRVGGTGLGSATVTFSELGAPRLVGSAACDGFTSLLTAVEAPITFTFAFAVSQATPGPGQVLDGITVSFVTGGGGDDAIPTGSQGTVRRLER